MVPCIPQHSLLLIGFRGFRCNDCHHLLLPRYPLIFRVLDVSPRSLSANAVYGSLVSRTFLTAAFTIIAATVQNH